AQQNRTSLNSTDSDAVVLTFYGAQSASSAGVLSVSIGQCLPQDHCQQGTGRENDSPGFPAQPPISALPVR
ncbi:hypothetical protein, partial [Microbacterium sp. Bi128]|uniref:hypothetical protein n=1 Tax=Microbacterium sp. Bi128 TaxID=2821115 RepID=UPI001E5490FA